MIKLDEINEGIAFANPFRDFPDHFTQENQQKINLVQAKLNTLLIQYDSAEVAINTEFFSDEEIEGYALWKATLYYSQQAPPASDLKRKIFEAVLERFTKHYRTLAGRES